MSTLALGSRMDCSRLERDRRYLPSSQPVGIEDLRGTGQKLGVAEGN
jgi:hypothetical protein